MIEEGAGQVDGAIRAVLRDVLGLAQDQVNAFTEATPLLGSLPELDSEAVARVLAELQDRLGITIESDQVNSEVLATFGALAHFLRKKTLL